MIMKILNHKGDEYMLKFEYQFDENMPKVTLEMSPESDLPEVLEAFQSFLLGAGYVFNGHIEILEEEKGEVNA